jgi:membrane protease YdiL (CAAX protease family)
VKVEPRAGALSTVTLPPWVSTISSAMELANSPPEHGKWTAMTTVAVPVASPRWPIGSRGAIVLAVGLIVAHLLVLFGVGGGIARALELDGLFTASAASFAVLGLVTALDLALVFGLLMRRVARLSFREVGWAAPRPRDLALGLLGLVLCVAAVVGTLTLLFGSPGAALAHVARSSASFGARQRLFFALIGATAAFSEETIFRGILQPTLQRRLGRIGGLVVTAVVFALYHLTLRPAALIGRLAIGLVLGGLRDGTGTLWAPALAHALLWVVLGST